MSLNEEVDFIEEVREAARKGIIYTEHALDEMNAEEEIITPGIITAYQPTEEKWEKNFRTRKRRG